MIYFYVSLQNGDITVDSVLLVLRNTLGNPNDVSDFLLLQLDVSVEYAVVELLLESLSVQKDFGFKKLVLQRFVAGGGIKERSVFMENFASGLDLIHLVSNGQTCISFRI